MIRTSSLGNVNNSTILQLKEGKRKGLRDSTNRIRTTSEYQEKEKDKEVLIDTKDEQVGVLRRVLSALGLVQKGKVAPPSSPISPFVGCNTFAFEDGMEVEEQSPEFIDFIALGVTNQQPNAHMDHLNDILNYMYSIQAILPSHQYRFWQRYMAHSHSIVVEYATEIFNMQSMPAEVLPLTMHYINAALQKIVIPQEAMETAVLASFRLACKATTQQRNIDKLLMQQYHQDIIAINKWEHKILLAIDYRVNVTTVIDIMRLLHSNVVRSAQDWMMAKMLSQLALRQIDLVSIAPALLAGVIMRMVANMAAAGVKRSTWTNECYTMCMHHKSAYEVPEAILCKLLLVAVACPTKYGLVSQHSHIVSYYMSHNLTWLHDRAATVPSVIIFKQEYLTPLPVARNSLYSAFEDDFDDLENRL